jgi:hypothetical protein
VLHFGGLEIAPAGVDCGFSSPAQNALNSLKRGEQIDNAESMVLRLLLRVNFGGALAGSFACHTRQFQVWRSLQVQRQVDFTINPTDAPSHVFLSSH